MDKKTFKASFNRLLESSVDGLAREQKIKYMKKWIKDYENTNEIKIGKPVASDGAVHLDNSQKVGELVRKTLVSRV